MRHVDGPLGIKSDFDADFELSKKNLISDFLCTKNGQRLNLYKCGVSDVAIFFRDESVLFEISFLS